MKHEEAIKTSLAMTDEQTSNAVSTAKSQTSRLRRRARAIGCTLRRSGMWFYLESETGWHPAHDINNSEATGLMLSELLMVLQEAQGDEHESFGKRGRAVRSALLTLLRLFSYAEWEKYITKYEAVEDKFSALSDSDWHTESEALTAVQDERLTLAGDMLDKLLERIGCEHQDWQMKLPGVSPNPDADDLLILLEFEPPTWDELHPEQSQTAER